MLTSYLSVSQDKFLVKEIIRLGLVIISYFRSHRAFLLRLIVVLGVLIFTPVIGVLAVKMNPMLIIAATIAPLAFIGFQLLHQNPKISPVLILFTAAFLPLSVSTGSQSPLVASLLLTMAVVGIWVLRMLIFEKRLWIYPTSVNLPLLAFIASVIFSLIWSNIFRDVLVNTSDLSRRFLFVQMAAASTMILLPGTFLLVANYIDSVKLLKIMTAIMLAAGTIGLLRQMGIDVPVNTNGLFTLWVIMISAGLALFNRRLPGLHRILLLTLAFAWMYFRFGQQITWLAGWLPSFAALAVLVYMRSKRLFLIGLVCLLVFIALNADYYLGDVIEAETNESGHTRMFAWNVNWRVTGKHLLFGTGPAGYAAYYMSYFRHEAMATHSSLVDVVAQTGIVGLFFCLWFFFGVAWLGYKLAIRLRGRGDLMEALANAGLAGTVGSMIAFVIGDWMFPFPYTQGIAGFDYALYSWLFMGMIVVVNRLTQTDSGVPALA
jgi:hypothetical protein